MPNAPWQDAVQPFRAEGLHAAGRMRARVSLTSLIDVVFILLVFFMLERRLSRHRFPLDP